jgi:hypothetical protein
MVLAKPAAPAAPVQSLRAKDLKNSPCLMRPIVLREEDGQDGRPWVYWACEVAVLDRAGIVGDIHGGVRISWVRTMPQLEEAKGQWLACRPVETDAGVVLEALEGAALEVAERVAAEFDAGR